MLMKENKSIDRGVLKNLKSTYKYAKKGRKYLGWFMITNIILTIISIIIPIFSAQRIIALTSGFYQKLLGIIVLIFIVEIMNNIVRYFSNYSYNRFFYDVRRNLQLELARETLRIEQRELNNNSSGVFIERINSDTDNLTDIFAALIDYITSIIGNIGILISVLMVNIYIGLAYCVFIVIIILYNRFSSNINYKNRKEWKKSREKTGGFIGEIVRGAKDIKILDAEESFLERANIYMKETNEVSYKYQDTRSKLRLLDGTISDICDFIISGLILVFLTSNLLSIEYALIIYNYNSRIRWTANWIENVYEALKQFI